MYIFKLLLSWTGVEYECTHSHLPLTENTPHHCRLTCVVRSVKQARAQIFFHTLGLTVTLWLTEIVVPSVRLCLWRAGVFSVFVSGFHDAADYAEGERSSQISGFLHQNPRHDVSVCGFQMNRPGNREILIDLDKSLHYSVFLCIL